MMRAHPARHGLRLFSSCLLAASALVAVLAAGSGTALAASPAVQQAFVLSGNASGTQTSVVGLSASSPSTQEFSTSAVSGLAPQILVSPDGGTAYAGLPNNGGVQIVDTATGTVQSQISTDTYSGGIALSPGGSLLYIAGQNGVDIYNTATQAVQTDAIRLPNGVDVDDVAVSPDGSTLYATGQNSDDLYAFNASTFALDYIHTFSTSPESLLVAPSGSALYVMLADADSVAVMNPATGTQTASISLVSVAGYGCLSPNGSTLYAPGLTSGTVSVVNTATDTVTTNFLATSGIHSGGATGCAVSSTGTQVWVTYGGTGGGVAEFTTNGGCCSQIGTGPSSITNAQDIALVPDQAPTAAFTVDTAAPGSPTLFDAPSSTGVYSPITSYSWNFGDGTTDTTSAPTVTHVYQSPGDYTATLTVTDLVGTSTSAVFNGVEDVTNGNSNAELSQTVDIPQPPVSFDGTVTTSDGTPVPGLTVTVLDSGGNQLAGATTDSNGNFAFSLLPETDLTLGVFGGDDPGFGLPANFTMTDNFDLGTAGLVTNVSLPPVVTITANVNNTTGNPVPGATVSINAGQISVAPFSSAFYPSATALIPAVAQTTNASGQASLITFATANIPAIFASLGTELAEATNINASSDTSVTITLPTTPAVTVASSANPSAYKQAVTFTATVGANGSGGPKPTGTVTFSVDGTAQSPITLTSSDIATLKLSTLSAGSHAITATYSGDSVYAGGQATVTQVVSANPTTTTLTSTAEPSVTGQSGNINATVAVTGTGSGTPTGTVTFVVDGTEQAPATLSGGKASLKLASLAVGTHSIAAIYSGDANDQSSSSAALTQVVNQAATSVGLSSTATPSVYGQSGSLTATVSVNAPGNGTPTGTVTFTINGTAEPPVTISASGKATLPLAGLSAGTNQITAAYSGDSNYLASTSATFSQVVSQASTTTTLTSSKNPVKFGGAGTITATVKDVSPGTGAPGGTITFTIDGVAQPPVTVSAAGIAELLLDSLSVGTHSITATYSGDANHAGSLSGTLSQVVTGTADATMHAFIDLGRRVNR
jgi:DNA-binding beta-propeller fold protein YncE